MATLGENDVYRRFVPKRSTGHYMWAGRVITLGGGALGLLFAFNVEALGGIIQANYTIMSVFEPPIFIIIAAALFWRRSNTTGALAVAAAWLVFNFITLDKEFLDLFGLGGVVVAGREALGLKNTALSMADRAIWGFPIFAAAMVIGAFVGGLLGRSRSANLRSRTAELFARMAAPPRTDKIPTHAYLGIVLAVVSLAGFVWFALTEPQMIALVGKGANILVFMGLMLLFVLGCLAAVPVFVEPGQVSAEVQQAGITRSWTNRILGSGWSWLAIGVAATVLMVVLYFVTPAGKPWATGTTTQPASPALPAAKAP